MATAHVNDMTIGYEVIGEGRPWVLTPGGRFPKEIPGLRELAVELAAAGNQVLIWDRPNCGDSDVRFDGPSESQMQADALAALLVHLDMAPAIIAGGSAGARVSLLTAAHHPEVAAALATWWISGGVFGQLVLANHYCGTSLATAWRDGMDAVADLPEWQESIERNPGNRQRITQQDKATFIATMERWMRAYCPRDDQTVPGLDDDLMRTVDVPALVLRSGESDPYHTRATSEAVASLLPRSRLVEPPWGDREWAERQDDRSHGGGLFTRWPLLAPMLLDWAAEQVAG